MEKHDFKARKNEFGMDEAHSCPCGGTVKVCEVCVGDYHEKPEEKEKCHLKK